MACGAVFTVVVELRTRLRPSSGLLIMSNLVCDTLQPNRSQSETSDSSLSKADS